MWKMLRTISIIVCLLVLVGCLTYISPRKESESIRQDLLKLTPIGTNVEQVEAKLKVRHLDFKKSLETGFIRRLNGQGEIIGSKAIWSDLGSYRSSILETTSVRAYWGFDHTGRLIEIWVKKYRDSL